MPALIIIRGGGDWQRRGFTPAPHRIERRHHGLPQPLAVRRTVSFAEAIYEKQITVEGITARLVNDPPIHSRY